MYIAMNRFKVPKEAAKDFEDIWLNREVYLHELEGFVEFHLLKGPERDDHVLYSSYTLWRTYGNFEAWTNSEQFRRSHAAAANRKPLHMGHPEFEGFHVLQTVTSDGPARVAAE